MQPDGSIFQDSYASTLKWQCNNRDGCEPVSVHSEVTRCYCNCAL